MMTICPICHGALDGEVKLLCRSCGASYKTLNGVPLLVPAELTDQHEHQRGYFDSEFAAFADYRIDDWRASFNDRIFKALELSPENGPYLDVGVGGSGATVIEAARLGVRSAGCDLSVEGVVRAQGFARAQGLAAMTKFVVCTAERLPFPDGSVGCASAVALLEHLDDDEAAVAELARVVRPGGRVWVTVPHAYRHMPLPVWPFYWLHDRRIGHKRHYRASTLRRVFEQLGFRHIETQFSGHPIKILQYAALLVSERAGIRASRLWWAAERRDLAGAGKPRGALQLSAVFKRVDSLRT